MPGGGQNHAGLTGGQRVVHRRRLSTIGKPLYGRKGLRTYQYAIRGS
ncbi:MAG: hypothetical protein QOC94_524 [Actinoplanes sp.]|jgi:hypothetical protein|nr:hypothetical protein [Actinoplanes sp.]